MKCNPSITQCWRLTGGIPYPGWSESGTIAELQKGYRMPKPHTAKAFCKSIYTIGSWLTRVPRAMDARRRLLSKRESHEAREAITGFSALTRQISSWTWEEKFYIFKQPCFTFHIINISLTRRSLINSLFNKRTRCQWFMALNRASDVPKTRDKLS